MFKGKISIYKNLNGKENKIEQEFDNESDYNRFIEENKIQLWEFNQSFFSNIYDLEKYIDDAFFKRIWKFFTHTKTPGLDYQRIDWLPSLDKYASEYEKILSEKKAKENQKNALKQTIEWLKDYKKKFENEWRNDLIQQIQQDIKKYEEELKKF